jgi:hypothetical protein
MRASSLTAAAPSVMNEKLFRRVAPAAGPLGLAAAQSRRMGIDRVLPFPVLAKLGLKVDDIDLWESTKRLPFRCCTRLTTNLDCPTQRQWRRHCRGSSVWCDRPAPDALIEGKRQGSSACASRCVLVVAWALRASSRFCKPRSFTVNP